MSGVSSGLIRGIPRVARQFKEYFFKAFLRSSERGIVKDVRIFLPVTIERGVRYTISMDKYIEFYEEHRRKVFSYLMRMTGNFDLSRDIMQESYTRYLEHYGRETQNPALLYTIARNAFIDQKRKSRRNEPIEANEMPDVSADHEQDLMVREEYRQVLAGIQKLEKKEQDILALVVGGELSYRQIASIVGISEANVKVRVHRARLRLKKILSAGEV